MTVYSFACATPDNWSNWHFLAKTFGPGLIAGTIALMAYRVASTQKQIATNKYNLDMFDKRWSAFEEFYKIYNKITKCNETSIVDYDELKNIENDLQKCILKSEKLFEEITDNNILNIFSETLSNIKSNISYCNA
ncbi:hypothetical protein, partial [Acetobacter persici]|uniref:hypothetical protein n=1 Tax=Acetobacter persici TaxID=1076596 RepID=UPI001BA5F3EB